MSRGFFVGAGWGTVVAGLGLVVASQLTVSPRGGDGQVPTAVAVVNAPTSPEAQTQAVGVDPKVEAAPQPVVPQDTAPDMVASSPEGTAQPDLPAETASVDPTPAPDVLTPDGQVTAPVAERDSVALPEAQTVMTAPQAVGDAGTTPSMPRAGDAPPADAIRAAETLPDSIAPDAAPDAAQTVPIVEAGSVIAAAKGTGLAPLAPDSLPEVVTVAPDAAAPPTGTAMESAVDGAAAEAPATEAATDVPSVVRPSPGFAGKVEGVKTGRLPSIGAAPEAASAASTDAAAAAPEAEASDAGNIGQPPIERFARAFENADKKPLFAIVLHDTGGPDIDRDSLAAIPFPVSFMIDPMLPDAATAAQIYRAAGQEVLMIASGIPEGAQASDLAVSFEVMAKALPEAVAIVDLEQGGFQGNRTLATQVLALVKDQGRGVLSWDRGLNAASQVARREGVPSALIFRTLDGANEGSAIIRRYLDRAAFKAAQDGRVVVAGQTRPETVAALLEWAVEGRAATVAIAPATAVMTSQ